MCFIDCVSAAVIGKGVPWWGRQISDQMSRCLYTKQPGNGQFQNRDDDQTGRICGARTSGIVFIEEIQGHEEAIL